MSEDDEDDVLHVNLVVSILLYACVMTSCVCTYIQKATASVEAHHPHLYAVHLPSSLFLALLLLYLVYLMHPCIHTHQEASRQQV